MLIKIPFFEYPDYGMITKKDYISIINKALLFAYAAL